MVGVGAGPGPGGELQQGAWGASAPLCPLQALPPGLSDHLAPNFQGPGPVPHLIWWVPDNSVQMCSSEGRWPLSEWGGGCDALLLTRGDPQAVGTEKGVGCRLCLGAPRATAPS